MTTITINPRTKAGKTLLELARLLSEKNSGVFINEEETTKKPNPMNKIPNAETLQAMHDAENGIGLTRFENIEDLFKHLDS
jgi:antitoxin component of RelBE/YafQ-DinJ toxin-antitoxin module